MDPTLTAVSSLSVSANLLSGLINVILQLLKYGTSMHVEKELRKLTLTSLGIDEMDREAKKKFKYAVLKLVRKGKLLLKENGIIQLASNNNIMKRHIDDKVKWENLTDKKRDKKTKVGTVRKEKKGTIFFDKDCRKKNRIMKSEEHNNNLEKISKTISSHESSKMYGIHDHGTMEEELIFRFEEKRKDKATSTIQKLKKIKKTNDLCKENCNGCTRLFVGNLPFSVDEISLETFLSPDKELIQGVLTHVKWITDKDTKKFYGSAFVEMRNSVYAAIAVKKNGTKLMKRPIKINYAPARDNDVWPPINSVVIGGLGVGERKQEEKRLKSMIRDKPKACKKLFIGNLSYEIDENEISKLFSTVEVQFKTIRWLHHLDTGEFKGCGFVEFSSTNLCEKAASLNGTLVLGRPIKIDWAT